MSNLIINDLISNVQLQIIDNSTATRSRLLAWLNQAMRTLVADRDWEFLKTSVSATPANNQIDLSAYTDYDRIFSFRNENFCVYANARLSDQQLSIETNNIALSTETSSCPNWFRESAQVFTFYPGVGTSAVTATYIKTFASDYIDDGTTTIFPAQCRNLLTRMALTTYYEFDADDRLIASAQMQEAELRKLRDWDNRVKPSIKYDDVIGGRNYLNG